VRGVRPRNAQEKRGFRERRGIKGYIIGVGSWRGAVPKPNGAGDRKRGDQIGNELEGDSETKGEGCSGGHLVRQWVQGEDLAEHLHAKRGGNKYTEQRLSLTEERGRDVRGKGRTGRHLLPKEQLVLHKGTRDTVMKE